MEQGLVQSSDVGNIVNISSMQGLQEVQVVPHIRP